MPCTPAVDQVVDEPLEPRQVEVFVGLHRRGDGRDDAADLHESFLRMRVRVESGEHAQYSQTRSKFGYACQSRFHRILVARRPTLRHF